ncbi:LLM class flavin-dependent oxidoreductase [Baekduia soli]|uniref:LLM class flavin-dependent oxidoreductase n=1 Tax=Baekduia soli TaxID=496014 RepID=UPI001651FEAD|nr:LLM class flavin-dependent oxidoreductase [Baekduia soli]
MRFAIRFDLGAPRPWEDGAEQRVLAQTLEQAEVADRLGYDRIWVPEHHFLEEASNASAPAVFLAAASQRTRSIGLGLGPVPLAPGAVHPARVAEAVATLDLISGGRVALATGELATGAELGGFGIDRDTRREQWAEALEVVARMLVETPFAGTDGRHLTMPARNVVPKPLQRPHPPLWMGCAGQDAVVLAAERGLGALAGTFVEPEEAAAWVAAYDAALVSGRCAPIGFAVAPAVAVAVPMLVHHDEAQAIARGLDGAHFLAYAAGHYVAFGEHRPGRTSVWDEFERRRGDVGLARQAVRADGTPLSVRVLAGGLASLRGAIGTPDQVRDLVRRYDDAGVDELVLCVQAGRTEHAHVVEALELFAAEVLPGFAAAPERDAARRARRDEAVARALMRRPSPRKADRGAVFGARDGAAAAQTHAAAPAGWTRRPRVVALRAAAQDRAEQGLRAFVAGAGDERLERTIGSRAGLRAVFAAMARRFVPEQAGGFAGDIQYDLRGAGDTLVTWTVTVDGERATARPGPAESPALTIKLTRADFARLAGGDLDPVKALLTGRLDLEGDFGVAMRLGAMFGLPAGM